MSFTSMPLPKMSKNTPNLLSNIKTPASEGINLNSITEKTANQSQSNDQMKQQKEPPKGNILHVTNINTKLSYEKIKRGLFDLFCVFGRVYDILIKTKESGQHFAFIDYDHIEDAQKAWRAAKNQGLKLEGRYLTVNYCQDPKKNDDRKDQKCFLCHGSGHKAIKCPVKPQMIKQKPKKSLSPNHQNQYQNESNFDETPFKDHRLSQPIEQQSDNESSQSEIQDNTPKWRDKDYLRFLKLKRKLLKEKLNKKVKKTKKKKY